MPQRSPATAPRVLLTTDGSDRAAEAMDAAISLIGEDAQYRLLHVADIMPAVSPSGRLAAPAVAEMDERRVEGRATKVLESTVERLPVEAEPMVEVGSPPEVICRVAATEDADIVVVASRGAGLLERMLLGSVTRHVVQNAPCPVLVMRDRET